MVAVFDGQGQGNKVTERRLTPFFTEVFTPKTMTADSYIEKESYRRRDEYRSIYVVSSDGPVQNQILGNGAYRMAVGDLMRVLSEDKKNSTGSSARTTGPISGTKWGGICPTTCGGSWMRCGNSVP